MHLYTVIILGLMFSSSTMTAIMLAPSTSETGEHSWTRSSSTFAFNLYESTMIKQTADDFVFSPFGLSSALSLLLLGSSGKTAQEIGRVIRYPLSEDISDNSEEIKEVVAKEAFDVGISRRRKRNETILDNRTTSTRLEIVNSLWLKNSIPVRLDFKQKIYEIFEAEVRSLNPVTGVRNINGWIDAKTHHLVPKLLRELDSKTVLVLISVMYFKGIWKKPFRSAETVLRPFMGSKGQVQMVQTMHARYRFKYTESAELEAQVIELPYERERGSGGDLVMVIVLPYPDQNNETRNHLEAAERGLRRPGTLERAIDSLTSNLLEVFLPKFKVETTMKLRKPLEDMGMGLVFSREAELGGISNEPGVHVTDVIHKAILEVGEAGSDERRLAATHFYQTFKTGSQRRVEVFKVDRPFLYFLVRKGRKNNSKKGHHILYLMGKYSEVHGDI